MDGYQPNLNYQAPPQPGTFDGIQASPSQYPMSNPALARDAGAFKEEADGNILNHFDKLRGDTRRQGFVTKVFGILFVQMIVTTIFCGFCYTNEPI